LFLSGVNMPFFCGKNKAYCYQLYLLLGFYPRNALIYQTAFTHSSRSISDAEGKQTNNERLEFIGDAILDAVVADILYVKFPDVDEGKLTLMRSQIVKRKSLDNLALKTGVADFVVFRNDAERNPGHIAGNAFEALIGAIYYDRGYKYCKKFITKVISEHLNLDHITEENEDYKSLLLNEAQRRKWDIVFDTVESIEESERELHFCCAVIVSGVFITEGKAWTKKEAEQQAAGIALNKLIKKNPPRK